MTHISKALKKHSKNAPIIPSLVFFGEMDGANVLVPNQFPKNKPPLSAYQARQKVIAMYLALVIYYNVFTHIHRRNIPMK